MPSERFFKRQMTKHQFWYSFVYIVKLTNINCASSFTIKKRIKNVDKGK